MKTLVLVASNFFAEGELDTCNRCVKVKLDFLKIISDLIDAQENGQNAWSQMLRI